MKTTNAVFKIEKGIKIPKPSIGHTSSIRTTKVANTLNELERGESFLVRDAYEGERAQKIMREFNARQRRNASGRVFTSRKVKNGSRFWRVK